MNKEIFYLVFSISFSMHIFIMAYCYLRLRKYIDKNLKISSSSDTDNLKSEIKIQMILSLIGMALIIIFITSILLVNSLTTIESTSLYIAFGSIFIFSRFAKKVEQKIVDLPTDSEELEEMKKYIITVWHGKALPIFSK